jgi:hypothetical protein
VQFQGGSHEALSIYLFAIPEQLRFCRGDDIVGEGQGFYVEVRFRLESELCQ